MGHSRGRTTPVSSRHQSFRRYGVVIVGRVQGVVRRVDLARVRSGRVTGQPADLAPRLPVRPAIVRATAGSSSGRRYLAAAGRRSIGKTPRAGARDLARRDARYEARGVVVSRWRELAVSNFSERVYGSAFLDTRDSFDHQVGAEPFERDIGLDR